LNNEGTKVANGLSKPDEGSLNRTVCIFFLNENWIHPPSGLQFQTTVNQMTWSSGWEGEGFY